MAKQNSKSSRRKRSDPLSAAKKPSGLQGSTRSKPLSHVAKKKEQDRAFKITTSSKPGSHGVKKKEQDRLSEAFKITVSGMTHESEHPIGYEPIARGLDAKRGKDPQARRLENRAMAYQEVKDLHRAHIGTGTKGKDTDMGKAFGLSSKEYRDAQRTMIESGHLGDALQLNQMGYAFDPNTEKTWKTTEGQAATSSYNYMLTHTTDLEYRDQGKNSTATFSYEDKLEAFVARQIVAKKEYPAAEELESYKEEFDRPIVDQLREKWKDVVDPITGEKFSAYFEDVRQGGQLKRKAGADTASSMNDPFSLGGEARGTKPRREESTKRARRASGLDAAANPFSLEASHKKKAGAPGTEPSSTVAHLLGALL